ncbi:MULTISPECIES: aryl-sulfate sulfotransferase [unclassified Nocardioides]|uniref:aryl-sulfate sulfotransferase n=1 Tax=unclassified Nocardioides TaxID=2615069 RepID=UPI000A8CCAB6|nr:MULTISPECIES: aryl-sulfate sulfotransferase [unclassified Nocardioides]
MLRSYVVLALAVALSGAGPLLPGGHAAPASAVATTPAAAPVHSVSVDGTGVAMYPAFDPSVERYGVTTTAGTEGRVTVTATTSDPRGTVLVNGRPTTGSRTITGLAEGDEISVIIDDSAGHAVHSLIHLPAGFPTLERTTPVSDQVTPGHVLLTLSRFTSGPFFETAVDRNGVPVHVHTETTSSIDFKRQPNGSLSSSRASAVSPGRNGQALVELDEALQPLRTHETEGLVNTDPHDSILAADGSTYLLAYERNPATQMTDAVIQGFAPDGELMFDWNSADHVDIDAETVEHDAGEKADYAHINSIVLTADGNLLASFRHFSSVFKIALETEDGHAQGDVLWRLGGHRSDLDFVDDPYYGPCAQHTASELPNGNILIFDNGSYGGGFDEFCINPDDPAGPEVARPFTRITEYEIDETAGTARLISSFTEPDRGALFAGGVAQLPNGNRLIGWASSRAVTATELSATGQKIWELRDTNPLVNDRLFTYRAHLAAIADTEAPVATLRGPVEGSTYVQGQRVPVTTDCTDRGGSSLVTCRVTGASDGLLATSTAGHHTVRLTAVDGAGHTVVRTIGYDVQAAQPDTQVKKSTAARYTGIDVYGGAERQSITHRLLKAGRTGISQVRLVNDGAKAYRFRLRGTAGSKRFAVDYYVGSRRVTPAAVAGTLTTPWLRPSQGFVVKVRITRTAYARPGDHRTFTVRGTSVAPYPRSDTIGVIATTR